MKNLKTFEQFIISVNEDAIKAGEESEVVIDDMITARGKEISSEELLGIVISSETEEEVVDKMYDKFGQLSFATEDIEKVKKYFNDYQAELKEKEKEAEKEAEGGDGADGGDEDPLAGM
jgi:hypothetical protein